MTNITTCTTVTTVVYSLKIKGVLWGELILRKGSCFLQRGRLNFYLEVSMKLRDKIMVLQAKLKGMVKNNG